MSSSLGECRRGGTYCSSVFSNNDPMTGRWIEMAPMKEKRSFSGVGVVGDKIFVIGGVTRARIIATAHAKFILQLRTGG